MRNENSVILAGPVEEVRSRTFPNFGFLNLKVGGVRVTVTMNQDEFGLVQTAEAAKSATLWGGFFEARQDKKDPAKFWYNIGARAKAVAFSGEDMTPINQALVVGKLTGTEDVWSSVSAAYHIPKEKRWGARTIRVLFDRPVAGPADQEIMVIGTVQQYFNEMEHLHLKASTWQYL